MFILPHMLLRQKWDTFPPFVHDFCHITASANNFFVMRGCGPCHLLPTQAPPSLGMGAHIVTFCWPLNEGTKITAGMAVISVMLSVKNMHSI